jgi:hypothetical protein
MDGVFKITLQRNLNNFFLIFVSFSATLGNKLQKGDNLCYQTVVNQIISSQSRSSTLGKMKLMIS